MPQTRRSAQPAVPATSEVIRDAETAALRNVGYRVGPRKIRLALEGFFSADEIGAVVAPLRTFQRRIANGEELTEEESDRAVRLARIADHAERVFGDHDKAARWLRKPSGALDGRTPVELLRTETGARKVEEALIRIDHGIFA